MQLVSVLDDYGKPAWIIAMILGFLIWWPIGLGVLAYLIWSGRMGCGAWKREWKDTEFGREVNRWRRGMTPFTSTGNRAFDEYREETLRRLEEEAKEFQAFLQRLRHAKDKAEFDQFMAERRGGGVTP
jgi:biopolymer transport protein ExbB/TolQ